MQKHYPEAILVGALFAVWYACNLNAEAHRSVPVGKRTNGPGQKLNSRSLCGETSVDLRAAEPSVIISGLQTES